MIEFNIPHATTHPIKFEIHEGEVQSWHSTNDTSKQWIHRVIPPHCHNHPKVRATHRYGNRSWYYYICEKCHSLYMKTKLQKRKAYFAKRKARADAREQRKVAILQKHKARIKSASIGHFLKWPKALPGATIIFRQNGKLYSRDNKTSTVTNYTPEQVRQLLSQGKAIVIPVETPF